MKNKIPVLNLILLTIVLGLLVSTYSLNKGFRALESEILNEHQMKDWLYVNGKQFNREAIIELNQRYYIDFEFIKDEIYNDIELSNSGQRVYIKIDPKWLDLDNLALNDYISENIVDINIPLISENGKKYLPLDTISRVLFFQYGFNNNDAWLITFDSLQKATVNDGKIYINKNLNIVKDSVEKSSEFFTSVNDGIAFIVNEEYLGYVPEKNIKINEIENLYFSKYFKADRLKIEEPFYLVWDQINSYDESMNFNHELTEESADIISPTVLELNINGIVINSADLQYTQWVHGMDKALWVLVSNSFNPDWTREMLSNPELMDRFIAQLCVLTMIYDFDGINIDFENIYLEDQNLLNVFMERLYSITKLMDIPLSMDITIPEGSDQWSKVYDRNSLAKSVDYMFLMAYDEFWASSEISGPVASIPWTIKGIEATLQFISNDKLVLGIPGYMRVWKDYQNSNESSVLSIKNREEYIENNELTVEYSPELMINFSEKKESGVLLSVWYEDRVSIFQRLGLVKQYELPGIGIWRRGFIDDEIESLIQQNLK